MAPKPSRITPPLDDHACGGTTDKTTIANIRNLRTDEYHEQTSPRTDEPTNRRAHEQTSQRTDEPTNKRAPRTDEHHEHTSMRWSPHERTTQQEGQHRAAIQTTTSNHNERAATHMDDYTSIRRHQSLSASGQSDVQTSG